MICEYKLLSGKLITEANALPSSLFKHYPVHRSHTVLDWVWDNVRHCQPSQIRTQLMMTQCTVQFIDRALMNAV
jgi:hypothetical protein